MNENDFWRDPTEDWTTETDSIILAAGFLAFIAALAYGIAQLRAGNHHAIPWISAVVGASGTVGMLGYTASTVSHDTMKGSAAEKLILGGFLLGFLCIGAAVLGTNGGQSSVHDADVAVSTTVLTVWLFVTGVALLSVFLLLGLVLAFLPRFALIERTYPDSKVLSRFGETENLMMEENHPSPWDDDMKPYVLIRLKGGEPVRLKCTEEAYLAALIQTRGTAVVKGNKLVRYRAQNVSQ